jgi:hypothetical protein
MFPIRASGIRESEKTTLVATNATGAYFLSLHGARVNSGVITAPIIGESQQSHGAYGSNKTPLQRIHDINLLTVIIILIGVMPVLNLEKWQNTKKGEMERAEIVLSITHRLSCLLRLS